jgi:hypothetical protein
MNNYVIPLALAVAVSLGGIAMAGTVKSAKAHGYRGQDIKKYNRLITKFTKKKCSWVKEERTRTTKLAGEKAKGNGGQALARVLNSNGTSGAGLLAQVGSNVVKDAALRRDASTAVLQAKVCK